MNELKNRRTWIPVALLVAVSLAFLGTFASQSDLAHTVFSSYSLLQGHVLDFYDFNAKSLVGNDYSVALYSVVAAWMSPIYLLGLSSNPNHFANLTLNFPELFWSKLGLITALFAASFYFHRFTKKLWPHLNSFRSSLLFAFSPFVLFAVVVMGQYDVIGLLLTMIALDAWLSGKHWLFIVALSMGTCFKYFPLLLLGPLVLFGVSSLKHFVRDLVVILVPVGVQYLVFSTNAAFRTNLGRQPSQILGIADGSWATAFVRLAFLALVGAALLWFKKKFPTFLASKENSLLVAYSLFSMIFIVVRWNPQWLIYLVPFWALLQIKLRERKWLLFAEIGGFAGLAVMIANLWSNNLDDVMLMDSPLANLLPTRVLRLSDILNPKLLPFGVALAYIAILTPVVLLASHLKRQAQLDSVLEIGKKTIWLKPIAFVCIFILPLSACFLMPVKIANSLSHTVALNGLVRTRSTQPHAQLLALEPGEVAEVSNFYLPTNTAALGIDINTGGSAYTGTLQVDLVTSGRGASRHKVALDAHFLKANDSSFPGYKGWLEATFSAPRLQRLPQGNFDMKVTNLSAGRIYLWTDNVRPTKSSISLGGRNYKATSLVSGLFTLSK